MYNTSILLHREQASPRAAREVALDTPTAVGRPSVTKALLRSAALLALAWTAAAPAAPCAADCEAAGLDGPDLLLDELTVRMIDPGDAAEDAAQGVAAGSPAPLLFLAPRVTSILEDVFRAEAAGAAGEDAEPAADAARRSPMADVDDTPRETGPTSQLDHASILPKYQRQMYRTDI